MGNRSDDSLTPAGDEVSIEKFKQAAASMPDSANAHYNLGLALVQHGESGSRPLGIPHGPQAEAGHIGGPNQCGGNPFAEGGL